MNDKNSSVLLFGVMGMLHQVNSLVVTGNLWFILLSKILLFLSLVKHVPKNVPNSKDFKYTFIFSLYLVVVEILAIL